MRVDEAVIAGDDEYIRFETELFPLKHYFYLHSEAGLLVQ